MIIIMIIIVIVINGYKRERFISYMKWLSSTLSDWPTKDTLGIVPPGTGPSRAHLGTWYLTSLQAMNKKEHRDSTRQNCIFCAVWCFRFWLYPVVVLYWVWWCPFGTKHVHSSNTETSQQAISESSATAHDSCLYCSMTLYLIFYRYPMFEQLRPGSLLAHRLEPMAHGP